MVSEDALELAHTVLTIVMWVINVLNVMIGVYFIAKTRNFALIHANLRLILNASLVIALNLISLARLADHVNENHFFQPFSAYPHTNYWPAIWVRNGLCLLLRVLHDSGVFVSAIAILLIAIERLVATVFR